MCCKFKNMKQAFIARFNRKPLTRRISGILCWSVGLITAALILSGCFLTAFAFVSLIAFAYLALVLACKKIEEQNIRCMVNNCTFAAHRTVDIMLERIGKMSESDIARKEMEKDNYCRAAIMNTMNAIDNMQETMDNLYEHVDEMNGILKDHVFPELGIYISETDEDWVRCDVLGREIPYGLISLRISNRLNDEGINTFADLVRCSENEILYIPDFGPSSLERIKQLLSLMGLHLKMTIKKEDDIWYYKCEDSSCDCADGEDSMTAEEELLKKESDKENRV